MNFTKKQNGTPKKSNFNAWSQLLPIGTVLPAIDFVCACFRAGYVVHLFWCNGITDVIGNPTMNVVL